MTRAGVPWAELLALPSRDGRDRDLGYRAPTVCQLTGCSYRQLDYWCRTGLLEPVVPAHGSGSARLFTRRQVLEIALLVDLLAAGVGLHEIRRVGIGGVIGWLAETARDLEAAWLEVEAAPDVVEAFV